MEVRMSTAAHNDNNKLSSYLFFFFCAGLFQTLRGFGVWSNGSIDAEMVTGFITQTNNIKEKL